MGLFGRKKAAKEPEAPRAPVKDERPAVGVNATLSNPGPQYAGAPDPLETDHYSGTTSGASLRGKPSRGSREDPRW